MNRFELARAVDEIATRHPDQLGYGFADSQHAWHYDPAFEHARTAWLDWLDLVRTTAPGGTVVQIGLGRRGGSHIALQHVARRIVTVERQPARIDALRASPGFEAQRSVLIAGDPAMPAVGEAVAAAAPWCDVLLLDGADSYEQVRAAWQCYAPRVRAGGVVAIVDRCQAYPQSLCAQGVALCAQGVALCAQGVDQFVADLEREHLQAHGVRLQRHGNALAIHSYVQSEATRASVAAPALPAGCRSTPAPERLAQAAGFSMWAWMDCAVAVPTSGGAFCSRALHRNEYEVVLTAADQTTLRALAAAWVCAAPRLGEARRQLRAGQVATAAAGVAAVAAEFPSLASELIACVETAPWNRELLLALGMLDLFGTYPRDGVCLLERALGLEMIDADLMQVVATAYLQVLGDEAGARSLLATAKRQVRRRHQAQVCHSHLRGHVLWEYPQLLTDVRGVLEVGAHRGEHLPLWSQLEIADQCYVEANPAACVELERACRAASYGRPLAVQAAVGAEPAVRALHVGAASEHGSFLRAHALAEVPLQDRQVESLQMPVHTLDDLVAHGRMDASRYNLLFVDVEGSELEVLRGASELLRHIDIVAVAVFLSPVYDGAPLPQEIQTFLRELHDGDGFGLRAFEPAADPRRGSAVFRRLKARG